VEWVKKCPNPMPGPSDIEIRPFYETEDFAEVMSPEQMRKEEELRKRTS
jgi:hypothetical protein